ncbi:hypothetical protein, partial [Rhodococcus sp. ANT_H53B]|uniref:hypothetical protein n=1 Tax=Rhodococcus sp. ANT_H53B TaxID=2597357 RepID=UPI001CAA8A38
AIRQPAVLEHHLPNLLTCELSTQHAITLHSFSNDSPEAWQRGCARVCALSDKVKAAPTLAEALERGDLPNFS